jgi:hypothetical protein
MQWFRWLNNKKFRIWVVVGALLEIILLLQACSSLSATQDMPTRATWTPVAQPTDQPYQVESEILSHFGETPAVVIFGSQDPEDESPLQAINLSTEDVYDVAALTPGPISTWSRPIMSADKELYFQIGPQLYKLLPGGGVTATDLPFDAEDPVFCNWSWRGQVVCLNGLMTEGYLVDQDLNLVEMPLPAYTSADDSAALYPPYRVGENAIRIVQRTASQTGGRPGVFYRELDLETLTMANVQVKFDLQFGRRFVPSHNVAYTDANVYDQFDGPLDVLGLTDDAEKVIIRTLMEKRDDEGDLTDTVSWIEIYEQGGDWPEYIGDYPSNFTSPEKIFYRNQMVTLYKYVEEEMREPLFPGVYNLETGMRLFDSTNVFGDPVMPVVILPYGEDWLVGAYYGLGLVNQTGNHLITEYFSDEIVEAYGDVGLYVVSQPMEP